MARSDARVNVPVADRIILHLWEQDHQADHYLVTQEMTRPGIAEICALHPPNVSRSMRELMSNGWVTEHTRTVRGDERRQKTWQLTEEGRTEARERIADLRSTQILLRSRDGKLLEVRADEAAAVPPSTFPSASATAAGPRASLASSRMDLTCAVLHCSGLPRRAQ